MKKNLIAILFIISMAPFNTLFSQEIKAAVTAEPGSRLVDFYNILSERSGLIIKQVPLLPHEFGHALKEGLVDIAILPDGPHSSQDGMIQAPVWGTPLVLIGKRGMTINERTLVNLKTIAVFIEDEHILMDEILFAYSIEPRIHKVRHYDSLVRVLATGRAAAIYIPVREFEKSLRHMNEDRDKFGHPFEAGFREEFIVLSRRRADKIAPLMDRLIQALEMMKNDGTIEELNRRP